MHMQSGPTKQAPELFIIYFYNAVFFVLMADEFCSGLGRAVLACSMQHANVQGMDTQWGIHKQKTWGNNTQTNMGMV